MEDGPGQGVVRLRRWACCALLAVALVGQDSPASAAVEELLQGVHSVKAIVIDEVQGRCLRNQQDLVAKAEYLLRLIDIQTGGHRRSFVSIAAYGLEVEAGCSIHLRVLLDVPVQTVEHGQRYVTAFKAYRIVQAHRDNIDEELQAAVDEMIGELADEIVKAQKQASEAPSRP